MKDIFRWAFGLSMLMTLGIPLVWATISRIDEASRDWVVWSLVVCYAVMMIVMIRLGYAVGSQMRWDGSD